MSAPRLVFRIFARFNRCRFFGYTRPHVLRTMLCTAFAVLILTSTFKQPQAAADEPESAEPAAPASDSNKDNDAASDDAAVGKNDILKFGQTKVALQMAELEERMFRLADALKALEPENSSRLLLGLKYAREELILQQMKEAQELLESTQFREAATEEKQVLAKLQRLHDLLMSEDLDFQLKLERLRLLRDILRRLDVAIKEEERERAATEETSEKQRELARLTKRAQTIDDLIERQRRHVEDGEQLVKLEPTDENRPAAITKLTAAQKSTRTATDELAAAQDASAAEGLLGQAVEKMDEAHANLSESEPKEALPHQREALARLEEEKERLSKQAASIEAAISAKQFAAMRNDQQGNRGMTDGIADSTRNLGDSGARALGELIQASGSMSGAEDELARQQAEPAEGEQERALESLELARRELALEEQRLLDELLAEVRQRVMETLALMLEKQIAVRETTETLAPSVAEGSPRAAASVVALGKAEGRIIELNDSILTLVEETEFGIALPAALRVVSRSMLKIEAWLSAGDASDTVIGAEHEVEDDLAALLEAMKQMPASRSSSDRARRGQLDRQRELNRIIAELKMIRILQLRTNGDTAGVDALRAGIVSPENEAILESIEQLTDEQDDIRATTQRLDELRGREVQP